MTPTIKSIIFDLGNTLLYFDGEVPTIYKKAIQALAQYLINQGYPINSERFSQKLIDAIQSYYNKREIDLIESTTFTVLEEVVREYGIDQISREHLRHALDEMYTVTEEKWLLEHDSIEVIEKLKKQGYQIGLISNAGDSNDVQRLIDKTQLRKYFDLILISADFGLRKPHKDIFNHALNHWSINPEQAVMVGDKLQADIIGANNVGIRSVWIIRRALSEGNYDPDDKIHPDAIIKSLEELPGIIQNWEAENS
ncbi:MAG: HAD family hydrolase [Anaerolineaceae bacterium]|nr:HAD family hydrolase [Anaerolineaceae bacterium]